MNSALAGLLSGVAGGTSKYGQMQDEQRKFGLDQKAADQAQMRKESFAQFQYSLQDSGMVTKEGRRANNSQADTSEPGALESGADRTTRTKEEARVKAAAALETKRAADLDEKRKYQEGITAEADVKKANLLEAKLKREALEEEKKDKEKIAKAKTKEEKDFVKDSKATINTRARESGDEGLVARTDAAYNFALDNRDNPMVKLVPDVVSAIKTRSNAPKFEEAFKENKGLWSSRKAELAKTRDQLKEGGMSPADIKRAEEYLELQGKFK